tara:strand:+ start:160 stop:465 length:306 start_codon:yes stop_codon:yes gene_type:complete
MNRPYFAFLVKDLEELFNYCDLAIKKDIYKELYFYRKTNAAKNLLNIVEKEIGSTKDGKKWLEKQCQNEITRKSPSNISLSEKSKTIKKLKPKIISLKSKR